MFIFFNQAIRNFNQTGALFKSSKFLSKKITSFLPETTSDKLILELGPGNGVITKQILNSISKNSKLIVFELNATFCEELRKICDDRLTIYNKSATEIDEIKGTQKFDCVISSLPLTSIDKAIKKKILKKVKETLTKKGLFIQYQYTLLDYRFLKKKFKKIKLDFTLLNLPPSFIYVCENND